MDYLAYVYKIKFLKTGQYYIGYRYANIRLRRHPEDDLLIYYFSSSNIVKKMIKDHGVDTIQSEIMCKGSDLEIIFRTEQRMIGDNWNDPLLLNKKYIRHGDNNTVFKPTNSGHKLTVETKLKMIKTRKLNGTLNTTTPDSIQKQKDTKLKKYGNFNFHTDASIQKQKDTKLKKYGKLNNNTAESIKKMIETQHRLGIIEKRTIASHTPEVNEKRAVHFRKIYEVIDPYNTKYIVNNLKEFCINNNLSYGCMRQVVNGNQKSHKNGWIAKLLS